VGIVTGEISNLVVIDIDGEAGLKSLISVGLDLDEIEAPAVRSGGGGWHVYCRYPPHTDYTLMTRAGVLPSVDIRADGGLIIAPPSIHQSGKPYEWVEGMSLDDIEPIVLDLSWANQTHTNGKVHHEQEAEVEGEWYVELLSEGASEGVRNDSAARLAGRWLGMGLDAEEVLLILMGWNQANDPPLARRELETIVDSITRREGENEHLDRTEKLTKINRMLNRVILLDAKRITGDDPQIMMQFDQGDVRMSTENLLSPRQFVNAIARSTKKVVRAANAPKQAELAQLVLDIVKDEDAGSEATSLGDTNSLVLDFLDAQRVSVLENTSEVPKHGCFRKEGGPIWVSLTEFVDWANAKAGSKMSRRETAQQLTALGWRKHEFRTDEQGKRTAWAQNGS